MTNEPDPYRKLYCDDFACPVNSFDAREEGLCPACEEIGLCVTCSDPLNICKCRG